MFIHKLELKGFRSIDTLLELSFREGLTMFQGNNGLGKSSILKALRLLLFDKTDSKLEEYVNDKSDSFFLSLTFDHSSVSYKTTMTYDLKKSSTNRELFIDDFSKPKINTVSSVTEFLKELFDPNLSYHAIALMQNSSEILKVKDSERLDLFKKIRSIDYSEQAEELKLEISQLEDSLKEINIKIDFLSNKKYDFEDLRKLPFSEKEFESIQSEIKTLEVKLSSIESLKNSYNRLISEEKSYKEKIERSESLLREKQNTIGSLYERVSSLGKQIDTFHFEFDSLEKNKIIELRNCDMSFEEKRVFILKKFEEERISLEHSLTSFEKELNSLPSVRRLSVIDYQEIINKLFEKLSYTKANKESLEKLIKAHITGGTCPTCGQELKKEIAENYESDLTKFEEEIVSFEKEISENKKLKEEQETLIEEQKTNQARKKILLESKEEVSLKLENLDNLKDEELISLERYSIKEKELIQRNSDLKEKELNQNKTFLLKEKEEAVEKISVLKKEKDLLEEEKENLLSSLDSIAKEIETINIPDSEVEEKTLEEKKALILNYNDTLSQNSLIEERNLRLENEKKEDKKTINSLVKERDELSFKVQNRKEARTILLKHFPNYIIQETIGDTETSINSFIESVYNKPLNISLRSTSTSLKIEYGKEGRKKNCKNLSGAEEILVSLGFIHTLNEQIGLGFIALDEADQSLSEENTEKLFEIIQNMDYKQILIITHNKLMQSKLLNEGAHVYEFYEEGKVREA